MPKKKIRVLLFLGIVLSVCPRVGHTDFQLLDAIKEFGEKRFIKPLPPRIRLGPLRIHPTLRSRVQYDDNVYFENSDTKQDVIWGVQPGVILDLPFNRHRVSVGYEADMEFFTKSRNRRQNDQNQNFIALVNLHFPSWYINVLEQFSETSGRAGTTLTDRIPRYDQSVNPKIGYRWRRATFEAGFRHWVRDFRRQVDDAYDFQNVEWTGVVYYDLFARLKVLAEYQVAQIDYDDNYKRNGTFQQARIGLEGEVMPNMTVKLRVGPHFRNYETDSKPNFNSWVGELRVEYDMRENLKWEAGLSRKPVEATYFDINYYLQHLAEFGGEYRILPRWTVFSKARYYRHNYPERATEGTRSGFRRDDVVSVKSGLRFEPREWMEWEASYTYVRKDSNFSSHDYTDNRFTLSSAIIY